jgi:hypothetical protein
MDALLSGNLLNLPTNSLPNAPDRTSLPARNLERGVQVGLPSGQAVADAILGNGKHLSNDELTAGKTGEYPAHPGAAVLTDPGFNNQCPLWFYLLAESAVTEDRKRLGAVGGTIVAETLVTIMDADKDSFFQVNGWQPMQTPFKMQDFLKFAGVIPSV